MIQLQWGRLVGVVLLTLLEQLRGTDSGIWKHKTDEINMVVEFFIIQDGSIFHFLFRLYLVIIFQRRTLLPFILKGSKRGKVWYCHVLYFVRYREYGNTQIANKKGRVGEKGSLFDNQNNRRLVLSKMIELIT